MMKRLSVCLLATVILMAGHVTHADLIEYNTASGHVVYDTIGEQYWIWDMSAFLHMTWGELEVNVAALNDGSNPYYNLTGWSVASATEIDQLWSYSADAIADVFGPTISTNTPNYVAEIWYGRYDKVEPPWQSNPRHSWVGIRREYYPNSALSVYSGAAMDSSSYSNIGAWVTSSSAPVPEPATVLLLGSGLFSFAAFRRKFRK